MSTDPKLETIGSVIGLIRRAGCTLSIRSGKLSCDSVVPLAPTLLEFLKQNNETIFKYMLACEANRLFTLVKASPPFLCSLTQESWRRWLGEHAKLSLSMVDIAEGSVDAIIIAIRELIANHDALRFQFQRGRSEITINDPDTFKIDVQRVLGKREAAQAILNEFLQRQIRADEPWLTSAKIISVTEKQHVIAILVNHLVADGPSLRLMQRDMRRLLRQMPSQTSAPQLRYVDFAASQREWCSTKGHDLARYWNEWSVRKGPPSVGPIRRLKWMPGKKRHHTFVIPSRIHSAIKAIASSSKCTEFPVYLTLYALALCRWGDWTSIAIRSICDGRTRSELSSLVGLLTGSNVFDLRMNRDATVVENLKGVLEEYWANRRIQSPSIYAFPPHVHDPTRLNAPGQNIAVVINYQNSTPSWTDHQVEGGCWPPVVTQTASERWAHNVSPICLELTNKGSHSLASLLLHEDQLSSDDQSGLLSSFTNVLETCRG